jgi:hypothetical protein
LLWWRRYLDAAAAVGRRFGMPAPDPVTLAVLDNRLRAIVESGGAKP